MKKKYYLIIFFIIFVSFELYLRQTKPIINDSDLSVGWKLKPNLNLEFYNKNILGDKYKVKFLTNERGSRFYGDKKNSEIKVLVMGDSMTNGPYSSNKDAWFSVFAKNLEKKFDKKVYVESIGSGGYGNFQQYLLAKKVSNIINPDFVILQFCNNDYYNNTYEWESRGITRNQFTIRPYLIDDKIYYHDGILSYFYKSYIFENIRLIERVDLFINLILAITYNYFGIQAGMNFSSNDNEIMNLKKKSVKNTSLILANLKKEFYDKNLYIFNMCDVVKLNSNAFESDYFPFNTWMDLSKKNKLIPLDFMKNINFKKESFYKDTAHFSGVGNIQIGNELFKNYVSLKEAN